MLKLYLKYLIALLALAWGFHAAFTAGRLTPEAALAQQQLEDAIAQVGYGDSEIDELHRKISALVPRLSQTEGMIQDGKIQLTLRSGQSIKVTGENYIVNGVSELFVAGDSLEKIVMTFERTNTMGDLFRVEKREMTNPTPGFGDELDTNEDIAIVYYEMTDPEQGFVKVSEALFQEILLHEIKTSVLRTYKQYLRVTLSALEQKISDREKEESARTLEMIEFE